MPATPHEDPNGSGDVIWTDTQSEPEGPQEQVPTGGDK